MMRFAFCSFQTMLCIHQVAEMVMGRESTKTKRSSNRTIGSTHVDLLEDSNTREILLKLFQQAHCSKNVWRRILTR